MRLAVAGKGGVGKTTISAWLGDYLVRRGREVWLVDADSAYSLGPALGLSLDSLPRPLCEERALILERAGAGGVFNLNPRVDDLPGVLSVEARGLKLLVMGSVAAAGGGCACEANAVLKALLAHLMLGDYQWVIVDLEAGVEHLGRGTVAKADGLVVVSDASLRGLLTAARIAAMARELGLTRQVLVLNQFDRADRVDRTGPTNDDDPQGFALPDLPDLPELAGLLRLATRIPGLGSLARRQLHQTSVLDLPDARDRETIERACAAILEGLEACAGDHGQGAGGI